MSFFHTIITFFRNVPIYYLQVTYVFRPQQLAKCFYGSIIRSEIRIFYTELGNLKLIWYLRLENRKNQSKSVHNKFEIQITLPVYIQSLGTVLSQSLQLTSKPMLLQTSIITVMFSSFMQQSLKISVTISAAFTMSTNHKKISVDEHPVTSKDCS